MKPYIFLWLAALLLLSSGMARAQLYFWTDDNGVRHYSSEPPPSEIGEVKKIRETPFDETADQKRVSEDAAWLRQREEEASRQAEEAKKAEEAAQKEKEAAEKAKAEAEQKKAEEAAAEETPVKQKKPKKRKRVFVNPG